MSDTVLFVDNFRGFKNTKIPLHDVNFLVGENSTGKTSILGLLKLLSSERFYYNSEFATEEFSFGNFKDMVSAHAEDRTYFRLGLCFDSPKQRGSAHRRSGKTSILLTFKESEGLPRVVHGTAAFGSDQVSVRLDSQTGGWHYKVDENVIPSLDATAFSKKILQRWLDEHREPTDGYKRLGGEGGRHGRVMFIFNMAFRHNFSPATQLGLGWSGFNTWAGEIVWVAPIRTKPRRTYDELRTDFSSEGLHTPYLLRKIFKSAKQAKFMKSLERIGSTSGLFQSIKIRQFEPDVTSPFEVHVVLDSQALNISTVGYGVSQSLPVLVELLDRPAGTLFAIQQPEVHLHPRAQAALGDLIFEMASNERKRFMIETHSDFTIDRFRMNFRKKESRLKSQILLFERKNRHNVVTPIPISPSGELPSRQPAGYRRFFLREQLRILGL